MRLRLLNAANARTFDLRFPTAGRSSLSPAMADFFRSRSRCRNLVIAPGERYEVLVDFARWPSVELVTAPDAGHGPGMMMMPMMGARDRRAAGRGVDAVQARSGSEGRQSPACLGSSPRPPHPT